MLASSTSPTIATDGGSAIKMEKESSIIGYYEVSNNDAKMINRIFVDAVYAHLAPARLPGELEVHLFV